MVVNKGADKARREKEKIFVFGCWAAQLWLRGLKELLLLNQWVALVTRWLLLGKGAGLPSRVLCYDAQEVVTSTQSPEVFRVWSSAGSFPPLLPPRAWVFSAFLIYPAGSLTIYVIFWTPGMQRA